MLTEDQVLNKLALYLDPEFIYDIEVLPSLKQYAVYLKGDNEMVRRWFMIFVEKAGFAVIDVEDEYLHEDRPEITGITIQEQEVWDESMKRKY